MATDLLSKHESEDQFLNELYGDNVQTKEATTIRKSRTVVKIIELSRSLDKLLKDRDIYIIRRSLASCDSETLDIFDREIEKVISVRGEVKNLVKSIGWNERA